MPPRLFSFLFPLLALAAALPAQRGKWSATTASGLPADFVADGAFDPARDAPVLIGARPPAAGAVFRLRDGAWVPMGELPRGSRTAAIAWDGARQRMVAVTVDDSEPLGFRSWVVREEAWEPLAPRTGTGFEAQALELVCDATSGRLVLHACRTAAPSATQTWECDGSEWQLRSTGGPTPRTHFGMAFDTLRGRTVLFGGETSGGVPNDEVWEWDGEQWRQLLGLDPAPAARRGHAMAWHEGLSRVVVAGGEGVRGPRDDVWMFDGAGWVEVDVAERAAIPSGAAMVYDPTGDRMIVASGDAAVGSLELRAARGIAACRGTAFDQNGDPLPLALVHFVSDPCPTLDVDSDHVVATSTGDGTFSAMLTESQLYTAWCEGPPDENGARWVSPLVPMVAAGQRDVKLIAWHRSAPRVVTLGGLGAWAPEQPTSVRVEPAHHFGWRVPIDEGGAVRVPPLPPHSASLVLLDRDGKDLQQQTLEDAATDVELDPPRELMVQVRDFNGEPVSGARIAGAPEPRFSTGRRLPFYTSLRRDWRPLGETDAHGELVVRVPWKPGDGRGPGMPFRGMLRADLDAGLAALSWLRVDGPDPVPLVIADPASVEIDVRAARPSERLAANMRALLRVPRGGGYAFWSGFCEGTTVRVAAGLEEPSVRVHGRRAVGRSLPRRWVVSVDRLAGEGTTIESGDLRDVLLKVVDAGGAAVPGACVAVASAVPGTANHWFWHERFAMDLSGQQRLVFGPGRWVVYAFDGAGDGMALVEHGALSDPLTIRLEPVPLAIFRLRHDDDGDGEADDPVVGARPILVAGEIEDPEGPVELLARARQERINQSTAPWLYSDHEGVLRIPAFVPSSFRIEWRGLKARAKVEPGEHELVLR